MKQHHFLAYCLSTPWALMPERMSAYAAVLAQRYIGAARAGDEAGPPSVQAAASRQSQNRSGAIAVIPVMGPMVEWANQVDMCDGGTSAQQVTSDLRAAVADETVSQILMVFNTPGGSVYGISELGDEINVAKQKKPVMGIAQSLAASAGYWAMSQCTECYVTPGGEVGSIGVWMAHEDWSKALAAAGVDVTLISAGKYKTEGHPYGPLEGDAKAFLQSRTDDYYAAFTKAVSKGRGVPIDAVRNGMGQGRVLGADAAMAENMVDGVMSTAELVKKMQRAQPARGRSALAAARNELEILG